MYTEVDIKIGAVGAKGLFSGFEVSSQNADGHLQKGEKILYFR